MIVSDLQGNLRDYRRVLHLFDEFCHEIKTTLVLCGDLIHALAGEPDHSLEILDDLRSRLSRGQSIVYLMGNHEIAHILHWELFKAGHSFTAPLEQRFMGQRATYLNFLNPLPFALITSGGILINHSGISATFGGQIDPRWDFFLSRIDPYSWFANLDFQKEFPTVPSLRKNFDPCFGETVLETAAGQVLWEVFMNKNELSYPQAYSKLLQGTLRTFSARTKVHILVSAHLEEPEGLRVLNPAHLRICSSQGAKNDSAKKILVVDANKTYNHAQDLASHTRPLW
jgi:hypothetical protein